MAVVHRIEKPHISSNGEDTQAGLQGTIDRNFHLPNELPFWMRWKIRLTKGWDPVVVNKHVDSVTMPKWVASTILVSILGFGISSWWRASDQRDLLIELRTELKLAKEHEAERAKELKEQAEINKVYIDNMTSQLNIIKGMLSAQQLNLIDRAEKGRN